MGMVLFVFESRLVSEVTGLNAELPFADEFALAVVVVEGTTSEKADDLFNVVDLPVA